MEAGKVKSVRIVQGIGNPVAARMLVITSGFKHTIGCQHFFSFAGLVPTHHGRESSIQVRPRIYKQGDKDICEVLDIPIRRDRQSSMYAMKTNLACKACYDLL